jgi:hypothetical protein
LVLAGRSAPQANIAQLTMAIPTTSAVVPIQALYLERA